MLKFWLVSWGLPLRTPHPFLDFFTTLCSTRPFQSPRKRIPKPAVMYPPAPRYPPRTWTDSPRNPVPLVPSTDRPGRSVTDRAITLGRCPTPLASARCVGHTSAVAVVIGPETVSVSSTAQAPHARRRRGLVHALAHIDKVARHNAAPPSSTSGTPPPYPLRKPTVRTKSL